MDRYEIRCTETQTRKALGLDAPILVVPEGFYEDLPSFNETIDGEKASVIIPTTTEMIGWLDEKGVVIEVSRLYRGNPNWSIFVDDTQVVGCYYPTRRDAIIAAIDIALDKVSGTHK